jgi:hypothetical protein
VDYVDYLGNVTRFAVGLANTGELAGADAGEMLEEHSVGPITAAELSALADGIRAALAEIVDRDGYAATARLLAAYPPDMHLSDHDGAGAPHIHFARNGLAGRPWIGQTVAATLAHVVSGDPGLTLGRCAACPNFFVDQSRNRTRRFCGNACASRTTVAAYRARQRG